MSTKNHADINNVIYNIMEKARSNLDCPYITPLDIIFPSLFENVVLGKHKSFFQLDHQVDISLHLIGATTLRHSRELASLTPSWCAFSPTSLWLPALQNSFHIIGEIPNTLKWKAIHILPPQLYILLC